MRQTDLEKRLNSWESDITYCPICRWQVGNGWLSKKTLNT